MTPHRPTTREERERWEADMEVEGYMRPRRVARLFADLDRMAKVADRLARCVEKSGPPGRIVDGAIGGPEALADLRVLLREMGYGE